MKKKRVELDLEKLRLKTNMINRQEEKNEDSLSRLNEDVVRFKEALTEVQRKEGELEAESKKGSVLLEAIKPDFITKIKEQDVSMHAMNLDIDSIKKLQETSIEELKHLKKRLQSFDYSRVVELDKEMNVKLRDMMRFNANIEKNSRKIEDMFMEFEKNLVEFREFNAISNKLNDSFERYSDEFGSMKEELKECVKEEKMLSLKEEIKDLKKTIKECARKKDLDKLKPKRKRWFL